MQYQGFFRLGLKRKILTIFVELYLTMLDVKNQSPWHYSFEAEECIRFSYIGLCKTSDPSDRDPLGQRWVIWTRALDYATC